MRGASPDEVYALTAYLLFLNQVIPEDAALDKQSLPKVKMPIGDDYARLPDGKPGTPRLPDYPFSRWGDVAPLSQVV
jgi:cytochrome c